MPEAGQKGATMGELLEKLGLGLSRLLRYSYGGFLLVGLLSLLRHDIAKPAREAMGWELVAVTAVVIGAGAYAIHRGVVVPVHHALLCLLWWIADLLSGRRAKQQSANPTRYLGSLDVDWLWRIPAYTVLRRGPLFKEYREEWNVAHAESGLVLLTAEAFLLAGLYARIHTSADLSPDILLWSSAILFLFSFGGFGQHALECQHFRRRENEIKEELKKIGLLKSEDASPKPRIMPYLCEKTPMPGRLEVLARKYASSFNNSALSMVSSSSGLFWKEQRTPPSSFSPSHTTVLA
jgi:hypothetical protein